MTFLKKLIFLSCCLWLCLFTYSPNAQALSSCYPGEPLEIFWKGRWYAGVAIKSKGPQCYVHYQGYGKIWDEWVDPGRIRHRGKNPKDDTVFKSGFRSGDAVQVLWKKRWYPARVLQVREDLLKIRYEGYDSSWDEWVGPERYRKH